MQVTDADFAYVELTLKRIVDELKQKNCLSQEFEFLTKAERDKRLEEYVDKFIGD